MILCGHHVCENCNCGRAVGRNVDAIVGNANFAPVAKPKKIVRRDPRESAIRLEQRFKETMKILA